jgi:hypothetical protein
MFILQWGVLPFSLRFKKQGEGVAAETGRKRQRIRLGTIDKREEKCGTADLFTQYVRNLRRRCALLDEREGVLSSNNDAIYASSQLSVRARTNNAPLAALT